MRQPRLFGLDLLRAAAILLVLASHGGDTFAAWLHTRAPIAVSYGGQFGVDLFFVLSGFLIGQILLRQLAEGGTGFSGWRVFMARRWLRTLPAYFACILLLAAFWAPMLWPVHTGHHLAAVLGLYIPLLQNLAWPLQQRGFFDVSWTLAVEEWFYLGFSALLFALLRLGIARAYGIATATFLIAPIALRAATAYNWASTAHIAVFQLDMIAVGLVIAWVASRHPRAFSRAAWALPAGVAALGVVYAGGLYHFGAGPALRRVLDPEFQAVTFALFLPAATRWNSATGAAAATTRTIARLSYTLYLTHLTILVIMSYPIGEHFAPPIRIALTVLIIVLASVSLHCLVERPLMSRRPTIPVPQPRVCLNSAVLPASPP